MPYRTGHHAPMADITDRLQSSIRVPVSTGDLGPGRSCSVPHTHDPEWAPEMVQPMAGLREGGRPHALRRGAHRLTVRPRAARCTRQLEQA
jgi:hypothetical protein